MKRIAKRLCGLCLALLLCGLLPGAAALEQTSHAQILFLSAYAYDWDSVPDQINGVEEVLGGSAKMEYVFMNTKKVPTDQAEEATAAEIRANIARGSKYDAVLLEDDAALDFALEYRDELFAGLPMVFMGVNTAEKGESAHEDPLITGMVECFPYQDTIALARQLYPNATRIIGITDDSESGKGCAQRFYAEQEHFPELTFGEINSSRLTEQELKETLAAQDDSTLLMFLALVNDGEGNLYSLREATEFVSEYASVPVFKSDALGVGQGVLGGYVSSYYDMAHAAAEKMQQILNGTDPASIPVETMGGYPMFDHNQLVRFGIDEKRLPEGTVICNRVPSFYERNREVIWPAAGTLATLMLLALFWTLYNRKKADLREADLKNKAQTAYLELEEKKNSELSRAIVRAEKASRAKGDFLARMSHEIRTPLNAIIGETTLAQKCPDDTAKTQEYLRQILLASRHLLSLINDILDMSAIESEKMQIARTDFDLKEVVATVTSLYYAQCRTKKIRFEAKMQNVVTEFLVGDQLRLQQVILNLLSNAFKFTPEGGQILLLVAQEPTAEETSVRMRIMVQDTGCGMSSEYMERIFRPFEQESALTAREHGGSGLGLSITKNLVELMGGTIAVESEQGVGTTFTLQIPFEVSANQMKMDTAEIGQMRVMAIDDDHETLEYTDGILNHIGLPHTCERDPLVALEKLTKARNDGQPYTLCLVDWQMKGMDGVEVARRIRKSQEDSTVVVILSAYDTNEIADAAREAGVDACIGKPVFQSSLFNLLMSASRGKLVSETAKTEDYDFSGKRLLLVDDTELNREIANELLTMVGFAVDEAEDGAQAVQMFSQAAPGTYDGILMDVQMPIMNGYEATRAIRASGHPDAATVPILAMTANAFVEDIARSLEAGMDDHISKPIDTDLMYRLLSRYLKP